MSEIPEYLRDIDWQDIGHEIKIAFVGWFPDRELNPDKAHLPDVEKYSLLLGHQCKDRWAPNGCTLDSPVARELEPGRPMWQVESWEPLTLSPSLLCRTCGRHGFIKQGRWVPA
jgi:hypothetical protein